MPQVIIHQNNVGKFPTSSDRSLCLFCQVQMRGVIELITVNQPSLNREVPVAYPNKAPLMDMGVTLSAEMYRERHLQLLCRCSDIMTPTQKQLSA